MARQADPPWVARPGYAARAGETTRLNPVEAGRDRLEWRQTAEQSVETDFHLHQPGRFQRPAAVGDPMLMALGRRLAENTGLRNQLPVSSF
jgi:hypothetical protein